MYLRCAYREIQGISEHIFSKMKIDARKRRANKHDENSKGNLKCKKKIEKDLMRRKMLSLENNMTVYL